MTKVNVMAKAWEIYRSLIGNHLAKLSLALRLAWKEVKGMKERIEKMIRKYSMRMADDGVTVLAEKSIANRQNGEDLTFLKTNKADFIKYFADKKAAEEKACTEYCTKLNSIEGLDAIEDAKAAHIGYNKAFSRYIANDCMGPAPVKPDVDLDALNAKYPRAAAYLKANNWSCASSWAKAKAGAKAKERILNGESHATVIPEMEAEWEAYCAEHNFD